MIESKEMIRPYNADLVLAPDKTSRAAGQRIESSSLCPHPLFVDHDEDPFEVYSQPPRWWPMQVEQLLAREAAECRAE